MRVYVTSSGSILYIFFKAYMVVSFSNHIEVKLMLVFILDFLLVVIVGLVLRFYRVAVSLPLVKSELISPCE